MYEQGVCSKYYYSNEQFLKIGNFNAWSEGFLKNMQLANER